MQEDLFSVWNDRENTEESHAGIYVAVSGNTGAGKSTLVERLVANVKLHTAKVIGIDERALHHPLLKLMFYNPIKYSFVVQLNFLIQRSIMIYRWLSIGFSIIIERSHLDDPLFAEYHRSRGHISEEEYATYVQLAALLHKSIAEPDIYVYLDVEPEISLNRLRNSEECGGRPREFPSEAVKAEYVYAWYERYNNLYAHLCELKRQEKRFTYTEFMKLPATTETGVAAKTITQSFVEIAHLRGMEL